MSRSLDDLLPQVAEKARRLLALASQRGITLVVTQTLRSWEEQDAIYAQGRTDPGPIVTAARGGYSWHNFGRAFDVAIKGYEGDKTPANWYDGPWEVVGELIEEVGLEWGGRWKHPDYPHAEDRGGLTLAAARLRYADDAARA